MEIVKLLGVNSDNKFINILAKLINNKDLNSIKYELFEINPVVVDNLKKIVGVYCESGMCILGGKNLEPSLYNLLNILDEANVNKSNDVALFLLNLIINNDSNDGIFDLLSNDDGVSNDVDALSVGTGLEVGVGSLGGPLDRTKNDAVQETPVTLPAPEPTNRISQECINLLESILDEYNGITKSFVLKFGSFDMIRNQIAMFRNQEYLDIFDQSLDYP